MKYMLNSSSTHDIGNETTSGSTYPLRILVLEHHSNESTGGTGTKHIYAKKACHHYDSASCKTHTDVSTTQCTIMQLYTPIFTYACANIHI